MRLPSDRHLSRQLAACRLDTRRMLRFRKSLLTLLVCLMVRCRKLVESGPIDWSSLGWFASMTSAWESGRQLCVGGANSVSGRCRWTCLFLVLLSHQEVYVPPPLPLPVMTPLPTASAPSQEPAASSGHPAFACNSHGVVLSTSDVAPAACSGNSVGFVLAACRRLATLELRFSFM